MLVSGSYMYTFTMEQVRHGPGFYNCSLTIEPGQDGGDDVGIVQLSEDDQGLAAGQFTAFYKERTCIGSGVILESWDDRGFPICKKALKVAQMEDKSKLGKPVKIKVGKFQYFHKKYWLRDIVASAFADNMSFLQNMDSTTRTDLRIVESV